MQDNFAHAEIKTKLKTSKEQERYRARDSDRVRESRQDGVLPVLFEPLYLGSGGAR